MATIKEIAKLANVSIGTVDRVIHNRGECSKKTENKVKEIIKKLNYKPNPIASSLSLRSEIVFGIFLPEPEQDEQYWKLPEEGIKQAETELKIYKTHLVYYYYDKYSEKSFLDTFNKMLNEINGLNGLLIAPVISELAKEMIAKIPDNIPYVFIDSKINDCRNISYIGLDSVQSGILSARLMQLLIGDKGTIAIVKAITNDFHINDRVRGFLSYFNKNKNVEIKIYDNNLKRNFKSLTQKISSENNQLTAVFVPSSLVGEIADGFSSKKIKSKINIVGYDLTKKNRKLLDNGTIDFLISQRPIAQGYLSIMTLFKSVVLKEETGSDLLIPIDIITKENLKYYKDRI